MSQEYKLLKNQGYLHLKNFFNTDEASTLKNLQMQVHKRLSKNGDILREVKQLANYKEFWDLINSKKILEKFKSFNLENIKYLYNSHSVYQTNEGDIDQNWHRDNVCRNFNEGPDWDKNLKYDVFRVGIYLTDKEANTGLKVIPGTHTSKGYICKLIRLLRTRLGFIYKMKIFKKLFDLVFAKKIYIQNGDCIIFYANIYHASMASNKPRQAFFLSYGKDNLHGQNYLNYYKYHRLDSDTFFPTIPIEEKDELDNLLKKNNIYISLPKKKIKI